MASARRSEAIWIETKAYWEIKVQKDGTRKSFRSPRPGRKGKHEAEAKADKWLATGTAEMRFDAAWKLFLEWQKAHTGTDNYLKHESLGRLYVLPQMANRRLSAIKPSMWQACIDAGARAGLSRRSCANIRGCISAFLRHARRERWDFIHLEEDDIRIPNSAAPEKKKKVLSPDALSTLFNVDWIIHYGKKKTAFYIHAWRLYVLSGMRRGELCGLRSEDVSSKTITIRRNINRLGEETHGKNDNALRTFAITEKMRSVLDQQRAMLDDMGIVSAWVFPDEYGERADPNAVYDRWRTYREQHDIPSSIHELRHTFISINKSDMPLELLKSFVGHSKVMDTIGVYGHEIDGDQERAAKIADAAFAQYLK